DAKPSVSLRKSRGGEADHPHAPVSRCSSVSHHIQHGAASHNEHDRLPIDVELIEPFLQSWRKARVIFRSFSSWYHIGQCRQFHVLSMVLDIGSEILGKVWSGFEHTLVDDDKEAVTTIRFGMGDRLE